MTSDHTISETQIPETEISETNLETQVPEQKVPDHDHPSRGELASAPRVLRATGAEDDTAPTGSTVDETAGERADPVGDQVSVPAVDTVRRLAVIAAQTAADGTPSAAQGPVPRLSLVTASTPEHQQRVVGELDRLSLEQALLDVEVANARVIDLTARLVEANQRSAVARSEAEALRAHITALEAAADVRDQAVTGEIAARQAALDAQAAHLDAQKASTAYRWAAKVWNLRNALRS